MKYLPRYLLSLAVVGAFAVTAHAQAEEFRVGFVNQDRVLRESTIAKAAQAKLEQEFAKREKEVTDLGNTLKNAVDKFEREAPTMPESQRALRQKQISDQDRDFQRKRRELQEDGNLRRNEEMQQFVDRANKAVKQVAEAEKFDVILLEAAYINPKLDITEKVIKALNSAK